MIKVNCEIPSCGKELTEKGALIASPPIDGINRVFEVRDDIDIIRKIHICKECYNKIIEEYFTV